MPVAEAAAEVEGRLGTVGEPAERVPPRLPAGGAMGGDCAALPLVKEIGGGASGERAASRGVLPDSATAPPSALPVVLNYRRSLLG